MQPKHTGGRKIEMTKDRAANKLRAMLIAAGITMTELAQKLVVHKSDISHALSPRAKQKRYMKLRHKIRKLVQKLYKRARRYFKQALLAERYEFIENLLRKWGFKTNTPYFPLLRDALLHAYQHCQRIPHISLADAARLALVHPTTLIHALHNHPHIHPNTKQLCQRCLQLHIRWTLEDAT